MVAWFKGQREVKRGGPPEQIEWFKPVPASEEKEEVIEPSKQEEKEIPIADTETVEKPAEAVVSKETSVEKEVPIEDEYVDPFPEDMRTYKSRSWTWQVPDMETEINTFRLRGTGDDPIMEIHTIILFLLLRAKPLNIANIAKAGVEQAYRTCRSIRSVLASIKVAVNADAFSKLFRIKTAEEMKLGVGYLGPAVMVYKNGKVLMVYRVNLKDEEYTAISSDPSEKTIEEITLTFNQMEKRFEAEQHPKLEVLIPSKRSKGGAV